MKITDILEQLFLLPELKNFDPKKYENYSKEFIPITPNFKQLNIGKIANLINIMHSHNAPENELIQAASI